MERVVLPLLTCHGDDLGQVSLESRLALHQNLVDVLFSGLRRKVMDRVQSLNDHLVASRKDRQAKHALNGVGLQPHKLLAVCLVQLGQVLLGDRAQKFFDRVDERLAGLGHELERFRPESHWLHLDELFVQLFKELWVLDEFGHA